MKSTLPLLLKTDFPAINRKALQILQVNLGYLCNQSCEHCHVNAGPNRTELMDKETIDLVLKVLDKHRVELLDLTGGAPEMNPHFRYLVVRARERGVTVMDRCNLTILSEPGHEDLAEFLARHQVQVTASMPCYSPANVDKQRGQGVFDRSISGLQALNRLGYGIEGSGLELNLVYNPLGPNLPPPQAALEADYKRELKSHFNIDFTRLFTITNMPIQRFGAVLLSQGQFEGYMQLLKGAYRPENLETVMCRSLFSVDYQGYLYDCDFNQMLQLPAVSGTGDRSHLRELLTRDELNCPIRVADHCYGCTAGQGSSCGGALEGSVSAPTSEAIIEFHPS
ncbi:arsenosugar biosynthesis radical SAM (seleno)protein ArsS [Orrella daihaiensis]|uniref:Arsenosugar biosynthesis radical SAM protein ArsS n=1 Tax=Orrella daihaiensis TaxID=2782176 RepID=A0ABY4AIC4_9BURK|nr:arsenosugar biosynthesis radical SAM (seleno)protein ArsS [Orrella daihaiensis]UOD50041.1 arsenosugar biosynthesis radical SAM protein ArsS [Orrella daihaiensis]